MRKATIRTRAQAVPTADAQSAELQLFERIYSDVRASIFDDPLTSGRITVIITTAMTAVARISSMSGSDKKELVLRILDRIVDDIPVDDAEKSAIRAAIALAPFVIDSIVAAAKGQLGAVGKSSRGKCSAIC
jgi:hypothetical protein